MNAPMRRALAPSEEGTTMSAPMRRAPDEEGTTMKTTMRRASDEEGTALKSRRGGHPRRRAQP